MTSTDTSSHAPSRHFTLSDFDFELPPELIAQHPASERSASRLLDGSTPTVVDRIFRELPDLLQPGDLLVFNDTKVVKARIFGEKATGGKLELLIERVLPGHQVVAHMKVSKKPPVGGKLYMMGGARNGGFDAVLLGRWPDANGQLFHLQLSDEPHALMEQHGHVPLPPYIEHTDTEEDARRYQTVFARAPGAVAAPTAALHFDDGVLAALDARGIRRASVTLHLPREGEPKPRVIEPFPRPQSIHVKLDAFVNFAAKTKLGVGRGCDDDDTVASRNKSDRRANREFRRPVHIGWERVRSDEHRQRFLRHHGPSGAFGGDDGRARRLRRRTAHHRGRFRQGQTEGSGQLRPAR